MQRGVCRKAVVDTPAIVEMARAMRAKKRWRSITDIDAQGHFHVNEECMACSIRIAGSSRL